MSITIAEILKPNRQPLDTEILLAHALNVSRSHLHAFPEQKLTVKEESVWNTLQKKHLAGVPTAYLTGHKEFWSLDLQVTPATLIPRSETELLVELVLAQQSEAIQHIAELGTGSGAIALALAHEKPHWKIHATDICEAALKIAKTNATHLNLSHIQFYHGSWFAALPPMLFDRIVSNPPYVSEDDPHLEEMVLRHEPRTALIAKEDGLSDLRYIIETAPHFLKEKGWLWVEHGFQQAERVRRIFLKTGYNEVFTYRDLAGLERVTSGQWNGVL